MKHRLQAAAALAAGAFLLTATAFRAVGPLNAGLVRLRQDFRPAPAFALFDSLPALSPGLSSLEAFALTLPAGTRANADRTLWLSEGADTVRFAFHSERTPFDSTVLYLWAGDGVSRRTLRRRGGFDWSVPIPGPASGWREVVGFYRSFPPLFRVQARDPSLAVFERMEGSVLHVISTGYARLPDPVRAPDTAYSAPRAGEVLLLARGKTLAVVNPTRRPLRVRVLCVERNGGALYAIPPGTVHVYRGVLDRAVTTLAYTGAGEPLCTLGSCRAPEREFFGLAAVKDPS